MGTTTNNSNAHPVCRAIRELRTEQGMTQVELATKLDLLQPYVSAWERDRIPTVDQIRNLEVAMKVAPGSVLRRAGYITPLDNMQLEHHIKLDQNLSDESKKFLLDALAFRRALDGGGNLSPGEVQPTRRRRRQASTRT